MTSFGIEWDTTALVYESGSYKTIDKAPVLSGDNWSVSLESYHADKSRGTNVLSTDCFSSIEAQLGVFKSDNDKIFNIKKFNSAFKKFSIFWEKIIRHKKMIIQGFQFDLLTVIKGSLGIRDYDYYIDCAHSIKGTFDNKWAYTQELHNVKGTPQLTCGIKLEYIVNLFGYTTILLNECDKRQTKCSTIYALNTVNRIREVYNKTFEDLARWKINASKKLCAFIMLCNLYLLTLFLKTSSYTKALLLFKPRTNLRVIYDYLSPNDKKNALLWYKKQTDKNYIEILESLFENPEEGFVITDMNKTSSYIPILGIYNLDDIGSDDSFFTNPNIVGHTIRYMKHGNYEAPHVTIKNDIIQYSDTNELLGFDIGEWCMDGDNVHIEIRGLSTILDLLTNNDKKNKRSDSLPELQITVNTVITKFLNKIFDVKLPTTDTFKFLPTYK